MALGVTRVIFGGPVISSMPWPVVDPILVGVPVSALMLVVVSLMTEPPSREHLDKCFNGIKGV